MLSLNLESRILGLAKAKGLLAGVGEETFDSSPLLDPKALQSSSMWGPRLDRLMAEGKLETATVEALAWSLLDPGKGDSVNESWMSDSLPSALPDLEGRIVADRYESLSFLGEGALGRVYKAYDTLLHRWVALKFLKTTIPGQEAALLTEARAQAQVEHPHVCRIYEVGEAEGHGFIAMQWVEGATLAQAMAEMTLREKITVVRDLAEGVHAAHRRDLVHLDLKPGNVLGHRDSQGRWQGLVTDFGMVRHESGSQAGPCPMGTPPYSSPEQLEGDSSVVDRRSDVYSLGVVLYVMLTGIFPFEANSFPALLDAIREAKPKPLRTENRELPEDLEAVVSKCLEKVAGSRYPSAQALADDLQRFLDGEAVQAQSTSIRYRTRKWMVRNRIAAWVGSLGLVALLVAGGVGIATTYQARRQGEWAQHYEQLASIEEAKLRMEYGLPLHDLRPVRDSVRAAIRKVEGELVTGGRAARGPAHYALGRLYPLLERRQDSLIHLQAAYDTGFRTQEVKGALANALLYKYQWLSSECGLLESNLPDTRREVLKKWVLEPANQLLEGLTTNEGSQMAQFNALIAQAMVKKDAKKALQLARQAAQQFRPWDSEAWGVLYGVAFWAATQEMKAKGISDISKARDLPASEKKEILDLIEEGKAAAKRFTALAPGSPAAGVAQFADFLMDKAVNPADWVERLRIAKAREGLMRSFWATDPDLGFSRWYLAHILSENAEERSKGLGLDGRPALREALSLAALVPDDLVGNQLNGVEPRFSEAVTAQRLLWEEGSYGYWDPDLSQKVSILLAQGWKYLESLDETHQFLDETWLYGYPAVWRWAVIAWEHGEDPFPTLMAWGKGPRRPEGSVWKGGAAIFRAQFLSESAQLMFRQGLDPIPFLTQARDLKQLPPDWNWFPKMVDYLSIRLTLDKKSDGEALSIIKELAARDLSMFGPLANRERADLWLDYSLRAFRLGKAPGPEAGLARDLLVREVKQFPLSTELHERIAQLCLLEAQEMENPGAKIQEGLQAIGKALIYPKPIPESEVTKPGFKPRRAFPLEPEVRHVGRTLKVKGELELILAKVAKSPSARIAQARKALDTLEASLKENKNLARHLGPLMEEARRLARE